MNKRGQIAIWVIIALIIVVALSIVFVFKNRLHLVKQDEFSPQTYMQRCIHDTVDSAVKQMLPQGGFIAPQNYKLYQGKKIEYLCYNHGYFGTCIAQHPTYLVELEHELNVYVEPKIAGCYDALKTELERRGSTVTYGSLQVNTSVAPQKILVVVNKSASIVKDENAQSFNSFMAETRSSTYDLARVAVETSNQEAVYCYFDYLGYMLLHPEFTITKDVLSDDTKIYSITTDATDETLTIAIRGCAIPAGL